MSDPLQLSRIAVKPKALETFTLPDTPKLPERFVRQFGLEEYEASWQLWRQNAQTSIREALLSIKSQS